MSDIAISNGGGGWDATLVDGDLVLLDEDSVDDVVQRVVYRLMTWYGESPFDRTAGVPYLDGVFGEAPIEGVQQLLRAVIEDTEGVAEIVGEPDFTLDGRQLTMRASIRVGDADATVTLAVGG